jgi:hypothetical protein
MRLFTPYRTTYRPARSDTSRADRSLRWRRRAELTGLGRRRGTPSKPTHTSLVPLCVWGQARAKSADQGGPTAGGVTAPKGGTTARGSEQDAGALTVAGRRPGWSCCQRLAARRQAPAFTHAAKQLGAPSRCPASRSRGVTGPVHPSWPAPDLVTHSCTMWWKAFTDVVEGRRDRSARGAVAGNCGARPVAPTGLLLKGLPALRRVGVRRSRTAALSAPRGSTFLFDALSC